jgi:hypothetical protein
MAFLLAGFPAADRPYQLIAVEFMQACRKDTIELQERDDAERRVTPD